MSTYKWQISGQPLPVELDLPMVDDLSREAMRGYALVPKRGAEVGGLLLRRLAESGEGTVVRTICRFVPVAIEYRRGPRYLLSDADRENWAQAVERTRLEAEESGLQIAGLYRSQTSEGLTLTEEDMALVDACLATGPAAFLLIKPYATRLPEAGLLVRGSGGQFNATVPDPILPFRRKRLEALPAATVVAAALDPQQVFAEELERETANRPVRASRAVFAADYHQPRSRKRRYLAIASTAAACVCIAGFCLAKFAKHPMKATLAKPVYYEFGLQADKSPQGVSVTWDGRAPALQGAGAAALVIQDHGTEFKVPLSAAELQRGGVLYHNRTSDLHFQLEVAQGQHSTLIERVEYSEPDGRSTP